MKQELEFLRFIVRSDTIGAGLLEQYTRLKSWYHPGAVPISIDKITDKRWRVVDGISSIDIFTPYRALNYSNGIEWRLNQLAESYGYSNFYTINKGSVVIDIGANIGEFSIFCARHGAKVYAFEPDADIFKLLKINVENLNIETIPQCYSLAISETSGVQTFYVKSMEADSTLITPTDPKKYKAMQIKAIRLDDFIESNNIETVDLVKCDAEGAEPEVVASTERALPRIRMLALDCSPERNGASTWQEVKKFLEKNNFEILSNPLEFSRSLVIAKNKAL